MFFSFFTLKDSVLWRAYLVSDRQGSNFESCLCRVVSFHSPHYLQQVLLAQFSHTFILYTNRWKWLFFLLIVMQLYTRRKCGRSLVQYPLINRVTLQCPQEVKHHIQHVSSLDEGEWIPLVSPEMKSRHDSRTPLDRPALQEHMQPSPNILLLAFYTFLCYFVSFWQIFCRRMGARLAQLADGLSTLKKITVAKSPY